MTEKYLRVPVPVSAAAAPAPDPDDATGYAGPLLRRVFRRPASSSAANAMPLSHNVAGSGISAACAAVIGKATGTDAAGTIDVTGADGVTNAMSALPDTMSDSVAGMLAVTGEPAVLPGSVPLSDDSAEAVAGALAMICTGALADTAGTTVADASVVGASASVGPDDTARKRLGCMPIAREIPFE